MSKKFLFYRIFQQPKLLLLLGIIFVLAGVFEIFSNTQFFVTKEQEKDKTQISSLPATAESSSKKNFCVGCGAEIKENEKFCSECTKKTKIKFIKNLNKF